MLATSWKATGLVQPVWDRLEGRYKREQLAKLTGIHATDLSQLNTGKRNMTMALATRIANAVEGVTVFDLGASEAGDDNLALSVLQRLAAIEERQERMMVLLESALARTAVPSRSRASRAVPDEPPPDPPHPRRKEDGR